jgi:hypothetical protein
MDCSLAIKARERKVTSGLKGGKNWGKTEGNWTEKKSEKTIDRGSQNQKKKDRRDKEGATNGRK